MRATIAPLEEKDVEALSALAREIWLAHYPPIIGIAQTEYMLAQRYAPEVIREELARDGIWWDVLHLDACIAAFASSLRLDAPTLKLDKLYVHPRHQRRGYGGMLIAHALDRARKLGCDRVLLAVNKHNTSAIDAYRKHGFDIVDAAVKQIGGGFVMDDYIMAKRAQTR